MALPYHETWNVLSAAWSHCKQEVAVLAGMSISADFERRFPDGPAAGVEGRGHPALRARAGTIHGGCARAGREALHCGRRGQARRGWVPRRGRVPRDAPYGTRRRAPGRAVLEAGRGWRLLDEPGRMVAYLAELRLLFVWLKCLVFRVKRLETGSSEVRTSAMALPSYLA